MKVILFGATGMIGQGALRECLLDPAVERVLVIGRRSVEQQHPKLQERVVKDPGELSAIADELAGYDGCLFCLGISSAGMSEADYRKITYDLTLSAAKTLAEKNPQMTFIYVSGAGTDSSEKGRSMWARVKGQTENALLALPFERAYMFRPGFIKPMHGVTSQSGLYRAIYATVGFMYPLLRALVPRQMTTSVELGKAMLSAVKHGAPKRVIESADLEALAARA